VCERFGGASRQGLPTAYGCLKRFFKNRLSLLRPSPPRGTLAAAGPAGRDGPKLIAPAQASRVELQLDAESRAESAPAAVQPPDRRLPAQR